jgi:hypothetical protein
MEIRDKTRPGFSFVGRGRLGKGRKGEKCWWWLGEICRVANTPGTREGKKKKNQEQDSGTGTASVIGRARPVSHWLVGVGEIV